MAAANQTSNILKVNQISKDFNIKSKDLAEILKEYEGEAIYLSGDGYDVAWSGLSTLGIKLSKTPNLLITENAYSCAMVALRKYERGDFCTDSDISATYLRLPQAERERIEREKNK